MAKSKVIKLQGSEMALISDHEKEYISITDIARHKDAADIDSVIQNLMRNRNTIELPGFWEILYNPNSKPLEFEGFRIMSDSTKPTAKRTTFTTQQSRYNADEIIA